MAGEKTHEERAREWATSGSERRRDFFEGSPGALASLASLLATVAAEARAAALEESARECERNAYDRNDARVARECARRIRALRRSPVVEVWRKGKANEP